MSFIFKTSEKIKAHLQKLLPLSVHDTCLDEFIDGKYDGEGVFSFKTEAERNRFEEHIERIVLQREMREDYERMDDEAKSKLDGPIIEYLQKCPHCKIHRFYACNQIPYEDLVKLRDLICNTPPLLCSVPSEEALDRFEVLPKPTKDRLGYAFETREAIQFDKREEADKFEEVVEIETIRHLVLKKWEATTLENLTPIKMALEKKYGREFWMGGYSHGLAGMEATLKEWKEIDSIFFPPVDPDPEKIPRMFNALPESIQTYLKQAYPIMTPKDRAVFEEQVEVETLRQEILYRYTGMSEEKRKEISPKLKTIFSMHSILEAYEDEWFLENARFSTANMKQIHSIVFSPKEKSFEYAYDVDGKRYLIEVPRIHPHPYPPKEKSFEDYITRATALLHNVVDIAVRNRRMADYIVGPCLKKFAATVIKYVGDFNYLQALEKIVCVAMDPENCFSLLFEKHERLTPQQMDIIIGLIDIPFEAKSRNIEFIAHSSRRIKGQPAEKILVEFLKKI